MIVVATKCDKLKRSERAAALKRFRRDARPPILCSATDGEGIDELRRRILAVDRAIAANARTPMTPEVSVIIPTYNRRAMLREAVAFGARAMQRESFELIVVDDGSTDGTPNMLAKSTKRCGSSAPSIAARRRRAIAASRWRARH